MNLITLKAPAEASELGNSILRSTQKSGELIISVLSDEEALLTHFDSPLTTGEADLANSPLSNVAIE
jgi:hypothetical protein